MHDGTASPTTTIITTRCHPFVSCGSLWYFTPCSAIMTHLSVPEEHRRALGISDTLIRLSVGVEDEADILADVQAGLTAAQAIPL